MGVGWLVKFMVVAILKKFKIIYLHLINPYVGKIDLGIHGELLNFNFISLFP